MPMGLSEWIQLLPLVLPLGGAMLVALLGKAMKEGRNTSIKLGAITSILLLLTIASVVNLFYTLMARGWLALDIWYWPPGAFDVETGATLIHIDMLSIFMSVMFAFLGFFVAVYSIIYMEKDTGLWLYYSLLLTLVGGMIGVVYAGDFLTLFIFWETMSISSYALVAFRKDEAEPVEAGLKYLLLSAFGSTLILFTMSILYGLTGTLNLAQMGAELANLSSTATPATQSIILFTIAGLVMGFGVKAAIAPLCTWLPDAHPAAPSGISAMLSGVVISNGSYAILRLCLLFYDPSTYTNYGYLLSWFALLTMIYGNLMALTQRDIKRLLAYSSIVNVGYIVFGFSVGMMPLSTTATTLGASIYSVAGGLFHITTHMLGKGMLFLCAGAFLHQIHTRDLELLRGIGRRMPVTMVCFAIGALSLAGVPPLAGFYSKFFVIWGAIVAGAYVAAAIMVINSAFSVAYYLRVIQILVLSEPTPQAVKANETSPVMLFSIVILTLFIVGIGLAPHFFLTVAELAARAVLGLL